MSLVLHPEDFRSTVNALHLYDANRLNPLQGVRDMASWIGLTARSDVYYDYFNPAFLFITGHVLLWPLAIFELDRPLIEVARDALVGLLRRPAAGTALALVLLAINVVGLAAGLVPFLTLTVAYSFLAAAHFALPRSESGGPTAWQA